MNIAAGPGAGDNSLVDLSFLAMGGEMGERIRAFDWSKTPLGPPARWSSGLRHAVSFLLSSKAQIVLFWGAEHTVLYNDAYRSVFGAKHPHVLGLPGSEAWNELWDKGLRELLDGVVASGEAYWATDRAFFIERYGYIEETFFDVSYDPVRDGGSRVGGVFCIVSETTDRVIGARRLTTLKDLSERTTTEAQSAEEACQSAVRILEQNRMDLPFVLTYLLDADDKSAQLAGCGGLAPGTGAAPLRVDLTAATDSGWPLLEVLQSRRGVVVPDVSQRFGALTGGVWPEATQTAIVLPIARPEQNRLAGLLVAGISARRALDDGYRNFLDLVAAHMATAVANARSRADERRRVEALAEIDRAKTEFFSNVSHEFRTPLTLMLGPLEDLLANPNHEMAAPALDELTVVHRNSMRLLKLVNTLLDFSRIEAGRIQASYEPVDLAALTADIASNFRSACDKAGLKFLVNRAPLPEPVYVDCDMWEKIVLNLVSNAFKFTLAGEIEVRIDAVDDHARLTVRDTGLGIPPDELPHMFERFHRVRNVRGRTHEGTGIGLALVHELVKLHGGTLTVDSVPNQGSTFVATLPFGTAHLDPQRIVSSIASVSTGIASAAFVEEAMRWLPESARVAVRGSQPADLRTPTTPPPNDRGRVIWADDNADMRDYVTGLLTASGFEVEAVGDGKTALEAARARRPDLILSDVMMPELDGFGLLRELRADPQLRDIPIMLLTARAGETRRIEGVKAGADDYIVKPFIARELLARVDSNVRMARTRREAVAALHESEKRLRSFADTAPAMLWTSDASGNCTFLSRGWHEFTGQPETEGLGFGWLDAVHPEDSEQAKRTYVDAHYKRQAFSLNYRLKRADGKSRWVIDAGRLRFEKDGTFLGFIGSITDVHELKKTEESLRDADRRKDEFLATLAHELRGPLAPLSNLLQIMKLSDDPSDLVDDARAVMERQLGQLVRLVDDLLDVSRISRGKIELKRQKVELASVIHQALETCRPLATRSGHELNVDLPAEPIYLHADPVRLTQVVDNLVSNACKYTDAEGRIDVSVTRARDEAVISVRDNGIGIPADKLESIFEMFSQVSTALERSQGGLGIGLMLVKRLVELHGGSVTARSRGTGSGSEFVVRLPLLAAPERPVTVTPPTSHQAAALTRRILVVDDNVDAATSLAELLRLMGHEVHMAHDGEAAVEAAERISPALVLLDIGLPKMNGYEACREIRRKLADRQPTIIAITGWGQKEDREKTKAAGFDTHLVKPIDFNQLTTLIDGIGDRQASPSRPADAENREARAGFFPPDPSPLG